MKINRLIEQSVNCLTSQLNYITLIEFIKVSFKVLQGCFDNDLENDIENSAAEKLQKILNKIKQRIRSISTLAITSINIRAVVNSEGEMVGDNS